MKVCKYDPQTGESVFISKAEMAQIKLRRQMMVKKVIMCVTCKLILHQSMQNGTTHRLAKQQQSQFYEVSSFKNGKVELEQQFIQFFCNGCGESIGVVIQPSEMIKINKEKAIYASLSLTDEVQNRISQQAKPLQQVKIGCLSGLRIDGLKKLIVRLMYLKCSRYQNTLHHLKSLHNNYFNALNNFIKLINTQRAAEDSQNASKRLLAQQIKIDISTSSISASTVVSFVPQKSKVLKKNTKTDRNCDKYKDSCLSKTAFLRSKDRKQKFVRILQTIDEKQTVDE